MSEDVKIARINVTLTDKIGLGAPTWSKIEVGASVTREIVEPGGDEGLTVIKDEIDKLAKHIVEPFIATERAKVLKWIQTQNE